MNQIWVIAYNTFRQTVRQRLFYNIGIFGVGMMLLGMVVGNLTFGFPDRVVRSIGLSGVSIALNLIALLTAVGLVYEEIDRKTLFVVLTRPIHRWQYIVGRYVGLLLALSVALAGFTAVFMLTLIAVAGTPTSADVVALLVGLPEAAILGGVGLVLSCFSTPTVSAGIGLGVWIAAASTDDLLRLTARADGLTKGIAQAAYWGLPSLARFNFREAAIYKEVIDPSTVAFTVAYGIMYAVAMLAVASAILSRREMT